MANLAVNHHDWGCHLIVVDERTHLYTWKNLFCKILPGFNVAVVIGDDEEEDGGDDNDDWEDLRKVAHLFKVNRLINRLID